MNILNWKKPYHFKGYWTGTYADYKIYVTIDKEDGSASWSIDKFDSQLKHYVAYKNGKEPSSNKAKQRCKEELTSNSLEFILNLEKETYEKT